MSQFTYKAVDRAGAHVAGAVEAADRRSAVAVLAQRGHFVTDLMQQTQRGEKAAEATSSARSWSALASLGGGRVAGKDILAMTTQLSTAVRAGLPLLNCLELLRKQQRKSATKRLFDHLVQAVNSGQSLSEAMAEHPNVFGPLYLSMIRVGETGGILEQTSAQLAGILSREEKIKTNMKNASAYPMFVMAMGLISAVVIVTWILPGILSTVDAGAAAMPLPTRVLMGISGLLRALGTSVGGWIVLGALAVGIYLSLIHISEPTRPY